MVPSDQPQYMGQWHYADRLFTTQWLSDRTTYPLPSQWSEWKAVSRINDSALWQICHATNSLNPSRCSTPRWWPISQLRRLWPWRLTLCICKVRRQGKVYKVKLPTSILSWLRTTVVGECYDDYWSNTQTKLICITIYYDTYQLRLCVRSVVVITLSCNSLSFRVALS